MICSTLCSNAHVNSDNDWNDDNNSELLALVLRSTKYYVSGQAKIVLYRDGSFELRSGSQLLYTGSYNIRNNEIKFTVGDAVFYGSIGGSAGNPSSITFVLGGKTYKMWRQD